MNDKASLLEQLRLDRSASEPESTGHRLWWLGGVAVLVAAALLVWWIFGRDSGIPVRVVVARQSASAAGAAPQGASLLDASGYVVARRQATVSAKTTGKVLEVRIEEGQRVAADEIIARLDDSNTQAALRQARAQVAQAQANLKAAQLARDDARPIYERNSQEKARAVISAQAFDTAKATYNAAESAVDVAQRSVETTQAGLNVAERQQDDTVVRAPFAGVVTVKAAQPGEIVSPISAGGGFTRTGIGTIVDMDSLEVEVDVNENFINRVQPAQPATIRLNAYPDWEIPGEVIATIPTADRSKATVKVRVAFKEKDARVLPEMGARVSFLEKAAQNSAGANPDGGARRLVVPPDAVQAKGDTGVVYVVHGKTVERRTVRLGARTPEGQIVLSGIDAGAKLAIDESGKLTDGSKVKDVP